MIGKKKILFSFGLILAMTSTIPGLIENECHDTIEEIQTLLLNFLSNENSQFTRNGALVGCFEYIKYTTGKLKKDESIFNRILQ